MRLNSFKHMNNLNGLGAAIAPFINEKIEVKGVPITWVKQNGISASLLRNSINKIFLTTIPIYMLTAKSYTNYNILYIKKICNISL